jgi:steroid delta-isomerase-like uncharacterized protein
MSSKEIAKNYLEMWNGRDFRRMEELLHPEYRYTGSDGQEQKGAEAGLAVARMFAIGFPDGRINIVNLKEIGDTVLVEFQGRGVHKGELMGVSPTGRTINLSVCHVFEVRDGKIYRQREYMDTLALFTQLGVAKTVALAKTPVSARVSQN